MQKALNAAILVSFCVAAASISFVLSNMIGNALFNMHESAWDVWFDSDTRFVVSNMTVRDAYHWTLYKHPLFSLLLHPITSAVRFVVSDPFTAVRIVQAANAALSLALLWTLVARVGVALLDRALIALLFLASSTMLFWYTVPESFSFGATTLLIALHVAISPRPSTMLGYALHGLASLGTLSMTVTNWLAGLVATATSFGLLDQPVQLLRKWSRDPKTIAGDLRAPFLISVAVLIVAAVLALIQDMIFGEASLFFNVLLLIKEKEFVLDFNVTPAWVRPLVLLLGSIVVGALGTWNEGTRLTADFLLPGTWQGIVAAGAWVILLGFSLVAAVKTLADADPANSKRRRLVIASLLTLLFFVGVHAFYGWVTFLYSAHIAPYLLCLLAISTLGKLRNIVRALVVVVILFGGINNVMTFNDAVAFVHETQPVAGTQ